MSLQHVARLLVIVLIVSGLFIAYHALNAPGERVASGSAYLPSDATLPAERRPTESEFRQSPLQPHAVDDTGLQAKSERARNQALDHFGITEEQLRGESKVIAAAMSDAQLTNVYRNELRNALIEEYGADEGQFLFDVSGQTDWTSLKAFVNERAQATGNYYDDLLLRQGLMMGEITADEIRSMSASGVALPEDVALQLAATANFDTLVGLTESGFISDPNYIDPLTGKNALSTLIVAVGQSQHDVDPEAAVAAVRRFIRAGAEVSPQNGAFNPLDYALQVNSQNAGLKLEIAKLLLESGVAVENSHRQLIDGMPEGPQRDAFLRVFANYL